MLIVDTREKKNNHILEYFDKKSIDYKVEKLDCGDYAKENHKVIIDRKQNLDELVINMMSKDRTRFYREIRRARAQGIKLIILCEHGYSIKSIEDIKNWKPKYSKVSGKALMNKIYEAHIAYGIEFLFCNKKSIAKTILKLLEVDYEQ